jgi:hypothetical protein
MYTLERSRGGKREGRGRCQGVWLWISIRFTLCIRGGFCRVVKGWRAEARDSSWRMLRMEISSGEVRFALMACGVSLFSGGEVVDFAVVEEFHV